MTSVAIIGGGAAGIMAAISARKHHPDFKIHLFEKNPVLGKKILICGAGRCNVTNSNINIYRYYGSSKFIATIINQFNNCQIIEFLEGIGIRLYEEEKNGRKKGKIFPITNQAATVVELLQSELDRLRIDLHLGTEIVKIEKVSEQFKITQKSEDKNNVESFDYLILASGGKTYPVLGATGFGFEATKNFGHKIITPVPSALPLEVSHPLITKLAGMRVDAEVKSLINGEILKSDTDELMFTKYGLSGPVILNISREISIRINRELQNDCELIINFFPGQSREEVANLLNERWRKRPDQKILHSLYGLLPNKVVIEILSHLQINHHIRNHDADKVNRNKIIDFLSSWRVHVKSTKGWDEGEFTAGGIDTKEVKNTLESKIVSKLYFAGEVLNVDGDVGGFNLSWAWSSGFVAGRLG